MSGRQVLGRIVLAVLAVALLAAAGYAVYRLGFQAGVASVGPLEDLRSWPYERGPRFGWPDRMHPFLREPGLLRPGARLWLERQGQHWPAGFGLGSPWLGVGFLLLAGAGVVALVVVLFRWAFRSEPKPVEPRPAAPPES